MNSHKKSRFLLLIHNSPHPFRHSDLEPCPHARQPGLLNVDSGDIEYHPDKDETPPRCTGSLTAYEDLLLLFLRDPDPVIFKEYCDPFRGCCVPDMDMRDMPPVHQRVLTRPWNAFSSRGSAKISRSSVSRLCRISMEVIWESPSNIVVFTFCQIGVFAPISW